MHGETNSMARLKSALQSKFAERDDKIKIYSPKNCEPVKLYFRGEKLAKVLKIMYLIFYNTNYPII